MPDDDGPPRVISAAVRGICYPKPRIQLMHRQDPQLSNCFLQTFATATSFLWSQRTTGKTRPGRIAQGKHREFQALMMTSSVANGKAPAGTTGTTGSEASSASANEGGIRILSRVESDSARADLAVSASTVDSSLQASAPSTDSSLPAPPRRQEEGRKYATDRLHR